MNNAALEQKEEEAEALRQENQKNGEEAEALRQENKKKDEENQEMRAELERLKARLATAEEGVPPSEER